MTTITVSEDCGNAPKKCLLRDFNVAFAETNVDFILDNVSDDVEWTIVGDQEIRGKSDFATVVEQMTDVDVVELTIDHIITHGATAAVNGTLQLASGQAHAFCDVYEFSRHGKNAKIQTMTSYVIELTGD